MTADRPAAFKAALAALNAQFAAWVSAQASAHPTDLWADGARDYVKHASELIDEYKDVLGSSAAEPASGTGPAPAPASTGLFGAPAPGLFGAPAAPGGSALFGGTGPGPGTALFGAPPAGGGFGGFGGAFGAPPPAAAAEDDDDGEAEEEEATPAALDAGAAIAFKASARLHAMPPGAPKWVDRGRGVLTLRDGGGDGGAASRPHIVFTTDTGRVLLNAAVYKGLVTQKAKKPNMVTAALANAAAVPGEGGDGGEGGGGAAAVKLAPHLFGLGSEEEADAFSAALKEAVAKLS